MGYKDTHLPFFYYHLQLRKFSSVTAAKRSLSTEWSSKKDEQSAQQISVPSEADVVIIGNTNY